jgi:hypothetical protein
MDELIDALQQIAGALWEVADALRAKKQSCSQKDKKTVTKAPRKALVMFDEARRKYPGKKRGCETEFENFRKKHADWVTVLPILGAAVEGAAGEWKREGTPKQFIPQFQTWINQRRWEQTQEQRIAAEQKAANEADACKRRREEIRQEYGPVYQGKTLEELRQLLQSRNLITHHWLIAEIVAEKESEPK